MPDSDHARISSSSHSPPRGRGETASRPGQGPSIQYSFVFIALRSIGQLGYDLSGENVNIDASIAQYAYPVMPIDYRTIRPCLESPCLTRRKRIQQLRGRHLTISLQLILEQGTLIVQWF